MGLNKICSIYHAFAAVLKNGNMATWALIGYNRASKRVWTAIVIVIKIYSTVFTFAVVLQERSVGTLVFKDYDGDFRRTQMALLGVNKNSGGVWIAVLGDNWFYLTCCALAAILKDGSVVTLRWKDSGGALGSARMDLLVSDKIFSIYYAFDAVLKDRIAVIWGRRDCAGNSIIQDMVVSFDQQILRLLES